MSTARSHGQSYIIPSADLPHCGQSGYLFADAKSPAFGPDTPAHVDALVQAMLDQQEGPDGNISDLPPVFTYLGQFIDHDITLQGVVEAKAEEMIDIFGPGGIAPQERPAITGALRNVRTGHMDLDSLYGPALPTGNAAHDKLLRLMRWQRDNAKMRLSRPDMATAPFPDRLPLDQAADLLRLDGLMSTGQFDRADFDALPDAVRRALGRPVPETGAIEPNPSAAVIGDPRNDENLFVAQMHVAFLRFHNRMVDAWPHKRVKGDSEAVFAWARRQIVLHYQWLVMHVYLPAICDPVALQQVKTGEAAVYGDFLKACGHGGYGAFPMPLEFTVAAFRFGHSMVRARYDWNSVFGRSAARPDNTTTLELLFAFTGRAPTPPGPMFGTAASLPANWVIDWSRNALPNSMHPERTTRRIDTLVALPLGSMVNEGLEAALRNLVGRNLKRGIRLNIPGAQACISALNARHGFGIATLDEGRLTSGSTGAALLAAGYATQTPLWFYVLKEAEALHQGLRLGPLGTHLVAGTIAGLMIHDPASAWNTPGSHEGRWHPRDGARPSGVLVDSIPSLLRAALLLEG